MTPGEWVKHHEHNEGFLAGVAIGVASGALVLLG